MTFARDGIVHHTHIEIHKWEEDHFLLGLPPDEIVRHEGNLITSGGVNAIWNLVMNSGLVTAFDSAHSYIGVGDSATAAGSGQTDLLASTNKLRKQVLPGSPGTAVNEITFVAQFDTTEANFDWNEMSAFNAAVSGVMLNRGVVAGGTKPSSQVWAAIITIALA